MGTLKLIPETHKGTLTCLANKDFLWWAQGSFPHGIVHTHPDLVAPVLAQICGQESEVRNTEVTEPIEGVLHGGWSYRGGRRHSNHVTLRRKQISGKL